MTTLEASAFFVFGLFIVFGAHSRICLNPCSVFAPFLISKNSGPLLQRGHEDPYHQILCAFAHGPDRRLQFFVGCTCSSLLSSPGMSLLHLLRSRLGFHGARIAIS
ncbi:hypothetical protein M427DRAFT_295912 [Gonapodya prolifera JEL478]|uniref:Secreted protein n=1 Tax=Gonapodya prolifera (strain JEL478) TaxID=1344416 RepID=A0A139AHT9_GONPJ|nr:hypothetical protein M427DRAFT_295912 [Gonapodya prolifera JEL478]|eukprot:KXS16298.1 hypothetical protein M427DRAFT_295912 [Gonapodya prolifera JEL478]